MLASLQARKESNTDNMVIDVPRITITDIPYARAEHIFFKREARTYQFLHLDPIRDKIQEADFNVYQAEDAQKLAKKEWSHLSFLHGTSPYSLAPEISEIIRSGRIPHLLVFEITYKAEPTFTEEKMKGSREARKEHAFFIHGEIKEIKILYDMMVLFSPIPQFLRFHRRYSDPLSPFQEDLLGWSYGSWINFEANFVRDNFEESFNNADGKACLGVLKVLEMTQKFFNALSKINDPREKALEIIKTLTYLREILATVADSSSNKYFSDLNQRLMEFHDSENKRDNLITRSISHKQKDRIADFSFDELALVFLLAYYIYINGEAYFAYFPTQYNRFQDCSSIEEFNSLQNKLAQHACFRNDTMSNQIKSLLSNPNKASNEIKEIKRENIAHNPHHFYSQPNASNEQAGGINPTVITEAANLDAFAKDSTLGIHQRLHEGKVLKKQTVLLKTFTGESFSIKVDPNGTTMLEFFIKLCQDKNVNRLLNTYRLDNGELRMPEIIIAGAKYLFALKDTNVYIGNMPIPSSVSTLSDNTCSFLKLDTASPPLRNHIKNFLGEDGTYEQLVDLISTSQIAGSDISGPNRNRFYQQLPSNEKPVIEEVEIIEEVSRDEIDAFIATANPQSNAENVLLPFYKRVATCISRQLNSNSAGAQSIKELFGAALFSLSAIHEKAPTFEGFVAAVKNNVPQPSLSVNRL